MLFDELFTIVVIFAFFFKIATLVLCVDFLGVLNKLVKPEFLHDFLTLNLLDIIYAGFFTLTFCLLF